MLLDEIVAMYVENELYIVLHLTEHLLSCLNQIYILTIYDNEKLSN